MTEDFSAEMVVATRPDAATRSLRITLADRRGEEVSLTLSAAAAAALAQALASSSHEVGTGMVPTRMPTGFAVGSGRYEPVVLVRFENELPYGFAADQARRLGEALICEADDMLSRPALTAQ